MSDHPSGKHYARKDLASAEIHIEDDLTRALKDVRVAIECGEGVDDAVRAFRRRLVELDIHIEDAADRAGGIDGHAEPWLTQAAVRKLFAETSTEYETETPKAKPSIYINDGALSLANYPDDPEPVDVEIERYSDQVYLDVANENGCRQVTAGLQLSERDARGLAARLLVAAEYGDEGITAWDVE